MSKNREKPTREAKALSLYLMAFKATSNIHKDKSSRIKRLWNLVLDHEISKEEYLEEVHETLESFGGYESVVEKTVQFYIEKSGEWKLKGDDQYCIDAQAVADRLTKK